ncbi:MAG: hypothetical protein EOO50_14620 [Flavobacterium sp.]|uniref:hypothetical protein n=1 Tax=Flavobacterium sp. TaxID=239 RepID=UPI0012002BA9|nr:hypothetical protein [Flavobacterium sp.]RZJ65257.1 MAG: hypothetical protein EOO50_14620 [Flavobacterium sp.]
MGLFDFFKKKEPSFNANELLKDALELFAKGLNVHEVADALRKKGVPDGQLQMIVLRASQMNEKYFSDAKNDEQKVSGENIPRKSINDTFAEKKGLLKQDDAIVNPRNPEIEIISTNEGKHGDHFGALFGFEFMASDSGAKLVNQLMAAAISTEAVKQSEFASFHEARFDEIFNTSKKLSLRTVSTSENLISAYPRLETSFVVPFATKQIREWSHAKNLEAEIYGGGRDTFGFGFFATDYALNKKTYQTQKQLDIRVWALAFVIDKSDVTEINGASLSADFSTYMPNSDFPGVSHYDFIGVLLEYSEVAVFGENSGYILRVKLINDAQNEDFFTLDIFVNKQNMRISNLEKGMKLTGCLWFEGEIA